MEVKDYKYIVAGAGIFGAIIAERLASRGENVLVVEKRDHIAGNIYSYTDEKLGTAELDIECYESDGGYDGKNIFSIKNNDGMEIFHAVFDTSNVEEGATGYNRFISDIADATDKSKINVKELLANAGEAINRNSVNC